MLVSVVSQLVQNSSSMPSSKRSQVVGKCGSRVIGGGGRELKLAERDIKCVNQIGPSTDPQGFTLNHLATQLYTGQEKMTRRIVIYHSWEPYKMCFYRGQVSGVL